MYTRSLTICQVTVTVVYIIVGTIMYYFCGSYVASPAIGSAGPLLKKVGYGIALPGLLGSAILLGHVRIPSIELLTCKANSSSYLPSTSLSDSSAERSISLPTRPFTGSPGLVQRLLYRSSPMLSPVVSPSLVVLFPSSVRSSVHSSLSNPWAACGCTTIGKTSATPAGT